MITTPRRWSSATRRRCGWCARPPRSTTPSRCSSTASTRPPWAAPSRCWCEGVRPPGAHRPELRLPGAQGDPQGRGGGAAVAPPAVRRRSSCPPSVRRAPYDVPVTVKTRRSASTTAHHTYLEAGAIAQDAGAAAITLHGRTADQLYSGTADWSHIARLVEAVDIPVLGNGDIWEADDALRDGGRDRLRGRRRRTGLPGPALAVRRPGRCLRRRAAARAADLRRGRGGHAPARRAAGRRARRERTAARTSASTWPGTPRASPSARRPAGRWRWSAPSTSWPSCWPVVEDQPYPTAVLGAPRGRHDTAPAGRPARGLAGRPRRHRLGPHRGRLGGHRGMRSPLQDRSGDPTDPRSAPSWAVTRPTTHPDGDWSPLPPCG